MTPITQHQWYSHEARKIKATSCLLFYSVDLASFQTSCKQSAGKRLIYCFWSSTTCTQLMLNILVTAHCFVSLIFIALSLSLSFAVSDCLFLVRSVWFSLSPAPPHTHIHTHTRARARAHTQEWRSRQTFFKQTLYYYKKCVDEVWSSHCENKTNRQKVWTGIYR